MVCMRFRDFPTIFAESVPRQMTSGRLALAGDLKTCKPLLRPLYILEALQGDANKFLLVSKNYTRKVHLRTMSIGCRC